MTLILSGGTSMKYMMTLNLFMMPLKKILQINYTYVYLKVLWRVTLFLFIQRMYEIGGLFRAKQRWTEGKTSSKGNEGVYFDESYNKWGDMVAWLGGIDVSYHSDTPFEWLDYGYTTECRLGMIFITWCIVKLYCNVTLYIACHILILSNGIKHLGISVISWV